MNRKNAFVKALSLLVALLFLNANCFVVSVKAAAPEITFHYDTPFEIAVDKSVAEVPLKSVADIPVKTVVSNLRLINLEEPKLGGGFDTRATVLSDGGYFWEIPVIWIDEAGEIAKVCLPGKTYRPIFAYYLPKNVIVADADENGNYSIRFPEFLDGIFTSGMLTMIQSETYGLTFIASNDMMQLISANSTKLTGDAGSVLSTIVTNSDLKNYMKSVVSDNIKNFATYVPPSSVTENTDDQSASSSPQQSQDTSEAPKEKDIVALHCSSSVINTIGKDKLKELLNLIINVIEPQAVFELNKGFSAYSNAAIKGELGKEIGLYVYSSKNKVSEEKDLDKAVAFVSGQYLGNTATTYGYYVGVNVDSLYDYDQATGTYTFKQDEVVNLNNTIVHELMHAYMDDYTRTGMAGIAEDPDDADANAFPTWFVEGMATCVENAYQYHSDLFDAMIDQTVTQQGENRYTSQALLNYYSTYAGEGGRPSINSSTAYYNSTDNRASAYVSGYLASMYLGSIAYDYYYGATDGYKKYNSDNTYWLDSSAIRYGLDMVLEGLHIGNNLDHLINTISGGKYTSTEAFQNSFLTTNDDSVTFCVDVLNYLDYVSREIRGGGDNRANGNILLPFDTMLDSVIGSTVPDAAKDQKIFLFNDSNDYVVSTVDNTKALSSGGVKSDGLVHEDTPIQSGTATAAKSDGTGLEDIEDNLVKDMISENLLDSEGKEISEDDKDVKDKEASEDETAALDDEDLDEAENSVENSKENALEEDMADKDKETAGEESKEDEEGKEYVSNDSENESANEDAIDKDNSDILDDASKEALDENNADDNNADDNNADATKADETTADVTKAETADATDEENINETQIRGVSEETSKDAKETVAAPAGDTTSLNTDNVAPASEPIPEQNDDSSIEDGNPDPIVDVSPPEDAIIKTGVESGNDSDSSDDSADDSEKKDEEE